MSVFLPNGIGGTLGDSLVVNEPLYMSGDVWYVDSETGSDAASPAGKDRRAPLATLGQAVTNATAGDIIVLFSTHNETVTGTETLGKRLVVVGEGQSEGKPTATIKLDSSVGSVFSLGENGIQIRNIYFDTPAQASSGHRIEVTSSAANVLIKGCYFDLDELDDSAAVEISGSTSGTTLRNCTFINSSTTGQAALALDALSGMSDLHIEGCVFDAGEQGFSNYFAATINVTGLRIEETSLLRGADMDLTGSTGYAHIGTSTGGSRVDL